MAEKDPRKLIVIELDGSNQLVFGWPSWPEESHAGDEAKWRLASHLLIACATTLPPVIFDVPDFLYRNPDLTCEGLQRVLTLLEKVLTINICHTHSSAYVL